MFEKASFACVDVALSIVTPFDTASTVAGPEQRQGQQADGLEVPTERRLGEFVLKEFAGSLLAVVRPFRDLRHDLGEGRDVGLEHRLAVFVPQQVELAEDRRKAVEVLDREERVDALLEFGGLRGGFAEPVVDQRQHGAEDADGGLADVHASVGAAIISAEPDLARERRDLQPPPQFVQVPALPALFVGDEGRTVRRRRIAALLLDHLLRTEGLPHLVADFLVERDDPEDALRVVLAADAQILGERRGGGSGRRRIAR